MTTQAATPISELVAAPRDEVWPLRVGGVLAVLGAVLCLAALFDTAGWPRFSHAWLWGLSFVWTVVLGSLFFVGLQHITGSIWSVVLRRVAEALASPMWLVAVLFGPVVVFAIWTEHFNLFPWADAETAAHDHLLSKKQAYLNVPFFLLRALLFFGVWIGFSRYFVGRSLRQDRNPGDVETSVKLRRASIPFTLLFAVTATFAGIDWLMSLSPKWFSTIFGVYVFSGMTLSGLAAITIATVWLRATGRLTIVRDEHLYSLGALLFAFVCFWAYIAFSQYMLIWYANMPEESFYLVHRTEGGWAGVSIALALVRFAVPFLVLLSRRAKMNARILVAVSLLILAGQLLDLYWLIMPQWHTEAPALGWMEFGPPLLASGLLLVVVARFLSRHAPVAVGDPMLGESRKFHL